MDLPYDKILPEHLKVLHKLIRTMASGVDEESILGIILDELIRETGAEVGAFVHYDNLTAKFEPRTIKIVGEDQDQPVKFSHTIFRQVVETREAVLSFDVQEDEFYQGRESVMLNEIHAVLAFPLVVMERVYGILYFDSRKNRQGFNEAARQLLSLFAPIASLTLEQVMKKKKIENEYSLLRKQMEAQEGIPAMIGEAPVMKKLFQLIRKVADSDVSIIINGENGTGKDLVARAIHDLSPRKNKPYMALYIGNIPATILESELFGYKKGAFTGANADKTGLFEAVDTGTLFLDEIGDLSPELQTKLLRVLQNKEIKRLGENKIRRIDVRIIAATNRDIKAMVKDGRFREDLYYRLNVINITVPPLRERKTDIPLLISHFLKKENPDSDITVQHEALKKAINYYYPGNVRQLENIVRRAMILAGGNTITSDDIEFDEPDEVFEGTLEEYKNKLIAQRLKEFEGNRTRTALSLGISLRSLQAKVKELGL